MARKAPRNLLQQVLVKKKLFQVLKNHINSPYHFLNVKLSPYTAISTSSALIRG